MLIEPWRFTEGDSPVVASALHVGHELPIGVASLMAANEAARLREEEPYTDLWTGFTPNRIVVNVSRFVVDLDRPRERAVYLEPGDAWGLDVWKIPPTRDQYDRSLRLYDGFYQLVERFLGELLQRHQRVLVLDLHSFRPGSGAPDTPPTAAPASPDVYVGTGSLDRDRWGGLVDRFVRELSRRDVGGRTLDVRETVQPREGQFISWINDTFGASACALAVEVKKTFVDEQAGELDEEAHRRIGEALAATVPGLLRSI